MNCPSCGAAMRQKLDGFECPYCHHVAFVAQNDEGVRVLAENPATACPVCSIPLMDASLAGFRIGFCSQCHGQSVAMGSFQSILEALQTQQGNDSSGAASDLDVSRDMQRRIPCPTCRRTMIADWYSGAGHVILDTCEACSLIWLDHGELMRIAHASNTLRDTANSAWA